MQHRERLQSRIYRFEVLTTARKVAFPVTPEFPTTPSFPRLHALGISSILRCIRSVGMIKLCFSFLLFMQFLVGSKVMLGCECATIAPGMHARRGMFGAYMPLQSRPCAKVNWILVGTRKTMNVRANVSLLCQGNGEYRSASGEYGGTIHTVMCFHVASKLLICCKRFCTCWM